MKKIIALLLVALLALTLIACGEEETDNGGTTEDAAAPDEMIYNDFKYAVNESGNYEIVDYVYGGVEMLDIEIPDTIDERPVTGIAADAFKGMKNIKSVTLPKDLVYIGDYAFFDCDYITEIRIPNSVTTIGAGAFQSCDALADVTLSEGLVQIKSFAFKDCAAMKNVTLSEGLVSIGDGAFEGCKTMTEVTIPTTVIEIGDVAFFGCSALKKVTATEAIAESDAAILEKMNTILAAYAEEEGAAPKTATEAFDALEAAGIFVGGVDGNGVKYVWDQKDNAIVGAFGTADAQLIEKINTALEAAKTAPEDTYKLEDLLTAAGLSLDDLNKVIEGSKYSWSAETNRMERAYTIGASVFAQGSAELVITTTENSPMDLYAKDTYEVAYPPVEPEGGSGENE